MRGYEGLKLCDCVVKADHARVVQKLDNGIHWINCVNKTNHTPLDIAFLVVSVIQLLNNQGQYEKVLNMIESSRSALFPTYHSDFLGSSWQFLLYYCAASQLFFAPPWVLPSFVPGSTPYLQFQDILLFKYGRDLQSMDSMGHLVLFTVTSCAVLVIMSLCKHFSLLLIIYKKPPPPPLFSMNIFVKEVFLPSS